MRSFLKKVMVLVMACMLLSGCSKDAQLDDYATNLTGNSSRQSAQEVAVDKEQTETVKKGISKDEIKVGVLHLSDPAAGSGCIAFDSTDHKKTPEACTEKIK